ncbi:regulator of telomere elongation helicase 1 homolog [Musca vetustissima]|uniref:regulator of telomere elongation helicase 1 homolog n=1 Tax=Musca vetustissima TaxID=27455 RepID=UPI002AB76FDA|nr:regulator of telomere elongation helicase 1 homolog [Musca vetustissima]
MPETIIAGIPVNFPFEPYEVQRAYMEKVIICLRDATNGVLESPTGTGKTLSLLCSSLAWLHQRKEEMKNQMVKANPSQSDFKDNPMLGEHFEMMARSKGKSNWGLPKIIYASRTHSQLTQAMQELKRTSYSFMRAVVLGSRDQLCIHPEVMREMGNANKIQMCKLRVQTRTCSFHSRVESRKDDPDFRGPSIMDIEDLVKVGQKLKMCPYYASKELVDDADIVFMPYNYLLDPSARKANKIELNNTICILDEAHNIEKICEESASVNIRSSDVALAIEDTTHIMKAMSEGEMIDGGDEPKDFTLDDLALLKEMLLELEKAIDDVVVENSQDGATFPASYIFDLLGRANITYGSSKAIVALLDKLIQFMTVASQNSMTRKGGSYQKLSDLLTIVFFNKEDAIDKIYRSFKVHVQIEEEKKFNTKANANQSGWLSKGNTTTTSKAGKIINYWCFNPGFGMEQLLNTNVRSVILTSGTLAPLKPLIAELSIPIAQRLENPHIVSASQVYVKIIGSGPDREPLISNYQNRDNPKYISSLGSTIVNVARLVPDGLLVFFPSYPLLNQCVNSWQASGVWSDISRHKPIFVEPRGKEDFVSTMEQFYQSIKDSKGACFMAVCRGKVSEGLDFADRNGRAVIITGLPFPPLKDPKVILKKKYLEENRTKENELLTGQAWYSLDATRAVNQAIGRVIRHRNDYGAILLCDARFQQQSQVQQLSKWIRDILGSQKINTAFGPVIKELRDFFKNADKTMPKPKERSVETLVHDSCDEVGESVRSKLFADPKDILAAKNRFQTAHNQAIKVEKTNSIESWSPNDYARAAGRSNTGKLPSAMDFMSRLDSDVKAIDFNSSSSGSSGKDNLVKIHKRERSPTSSQLFSSSSSSGTSSSQMELSKKKKYKLVDNTQSITTQLSNSATAKLNSFAFAKKPQVSNNNTTTTSSSITEDNKKAPEDRLEFLKVLRGILAPPDFSAFTAALVSYKRDSNIDALLDLLFRILAKPSSMYLLRGMKRFLKNEHRSKFDERLACFS